MKNLIFKDIKRRFLYTKFEIKRLKLNLKLKFLIKPNHHLGKKKIIKKDNLEKKINNINFLKKKVNFESKKNIIKEKNLKNFVILKKNKENKLLPRNSSITRVKNRCILTGRGRGIYSFFKLSRIKLREMAHMGLLPGITKSSW